MIQDRVTTRGSLAADGRFSSGKFRRGNRLIPVIWLCKWMEPGNNFDTLRQRTMATPLR